jgi:hypothetical protein
MERYYRYFKCSKCGAIASTVNCESPSICTTPAAYRTTGVCGGYFIEISEAEFLILGGKLTHQS